MTTNQKRITVAVATVLVAYGIDAICMLQEHSDPVASPTPIVHPFAEFWATLNIFSLAFVFFIQPVFGGSWGKPLSREAEWLLIMVGQVFQWGLTGFILSLFTQGPGRRASRGVAKPPPIIRSSEPPSAGAAGGRSP